MRSRTLLGLAAVGLMLVSPGRIPMRAQQTTTPPPAAQPPADAPASTQPTFRVEANFVRVDVSCVGGLTEAKKVAGWAEAHYIDLVPHNPIGPVCTAATVHLAACCSNFTWKANASTCPS